MSVPLDESEWLSTSAMCLKRNLTTDVYFDMTDLYTKKGALAQLVPLKLADGKIVRTVHRRIVEALIDCGCLRRVSKSKVKMMSMAQSEETESNGKRS